MRLLICLWLCCVPALLAAADRPNILFIAVDDMRPDLGCYGVDFVRTPNLDRLAKTGLVFDRAYCQQAVCSPSRTSLMTGKRPDTTRVYDLETHFRDTIPDTVTLPQRLKQEGYHTVGMGKIYHGGLDDKQSWSEPHRTPKSAKSYARPDNQKAVAQKSAAAKEKGLKGKAASRASRGPATESADVPDETYHDGKLAQMGVESLEKLAKQEEPFFLAVGFIKPHLPFVAPKKYWDLYDRDSLELADNDFRPRNAPSYAVTDFGEMRAYSDIPRQGPVSDEKARELIHGYYAALSYTDAQIGKLLDALDRLKLADDTIVIVWGDHGWKLGEHASWCKHSNMELDTRVPLIIRVPGQTRGEHTKGLVEFVDIYPSLCELAGVSAPESGGAAFPVDLEGSSFVPLIRNPDRDWKAAAFSQYPRSYNGQQLMGYSLTDGRYRFVQWVKRNEPTQVVARELYDHQTDPQENESIAGDPTSAETIERLAGLAHTGWKGVKQQLEKGRNKSQSPSATK